MRSPFVSALLHPLNLAALALAAAAGLCAAWWLFPLGLVFWAIMFALVMRDPALRLTQKVEGRAPLAYRFDARFKRVQRSQIAIHHQLENARPASRRALLPVQEAINDLSEQTYQVCQRMSALENNRLVLQKNRNLTEELALIDAKIMDASDPLVKEEYLESRRTVEEQKNKMAAVATMLDRFEAQLMALSTTLDGVTTDTTRLQSMKPEAIQAEALPLLESIQEQAEQLAEFEKQATRSRI